MRTKTQRQEWLLDHFKNKGQSYSGNVLDSDLVDAYADANEVPVRMQFVGADKCPQLGRDLSSLFTNGYLSRFSVGLGDGLSSMGFPKWIWEYKVKP